MTTSSTTTGPRVIVALDFADSKSALSIVEQLRLGTCRFKVGKELFTAAGPQIVKALVDRGHDVFLDLKYHDIPNTVAAACSAAADLGVWMLNVHALGGVAMMQAAREAVDTYPSIKLIAVTVLTSMGASDLEEVGMQGTPEQSVLRLAGLAHKAGLHGVVCSGLEAGALRTAFGSAFCLVTPGIRPAAAEDDQKRVLTPGAAIRLGANYLVVGRPVTRAPDPQAVLDAINREIEKEAA